MGWVGLGWIGSGWVQIFPLVMHWVALGQLADGSGHTKWTHGQLCSDVAQLVISSVSSQFMFLLVWMHISNESVLVPWAGHFQC